ncbi:MAG TPA: hypothetical protein VN285_02325 [Candidatus Deferrimicrobium sp.]|nr:hypothetical protein [Candidatus Deferrimicrobium sp.]
MCFKGGFVLTALCLCCQFIVAPVLWAQRVDCSYDPKTPSLESARKSLKSLHYPCAEQELRDFLAVNTISPALRAEAHILLGTIYYYSADNIMQERDRVLKEFIDALRAQPDVKHDLDTDTSDLATLFKEARNTIREENRQKQLAEQKRVGEMYAEYEKQHKKNRLFKIATGALILGATTGALVVNSGANDSYDKYSQAIDPSTIQSHYDDYESKLKMRNILIGAGLGLVALEVFWFIAAPDKPLANPHANTAPVDVDLSTAGDHAMLNLTYRF